MNFRKLRGFLPLLLSVFVVSACTDEDPTDVGDDLLPSGDVRTFEVILDAASFINFDTTFSGYAGTEDAAFAIIANRFGGVVDANMLLQMGAIPRVITVRNNAGTLVGDSLPIYAAGRLVVRFDTLRSDAERPTRFSAYHITESWDKSATWTLRRDTGAVELPWSMPGGTRGARIDTATWAAGDTMVFDIDSATVASWTDTANVNRSVLITSDENDTRVRILGSVLRLSARSTIRPDTSVNVDVVPAINHFVFNPQPPAAGSQLRVGGVPSWRALIGLRPDLGTLTFPCPDVGLPCQIRLERAHVNRAELLLQPIATPPGFIPEDTTVIQARTLLLSPQVPLQRSPIGVPIGVSRTIAPGLFGQPAATSRVVIDLTNYIIALVNADIEESRRVSRNIVLHAAGEPATFGFASFANGPQLRLVLTAPVERAQ